MVSPARYAAAATALFPLPLLMMFILMEYMAVVHLLSLCDGFWVLAGAKLRYGFTGAKLRYGFTGAKLRYGFTGAMRRYTP